jgi:hypothetical protein
MCRDFVIIHFDKTFFSMPARSTNFITVSVTAFIPWLIIILTFGAGGDLPRALYLLIHYALVVFLFGIAFAIYFRTHSMAQPFIVMVDAMLSVLVYEFVFVKYVYEGELWFLNYFDWIVPFFLTAMTIYCIGKILKEDEIGGRGF